MEQQTIKKRVAAAVLNQYGLVASDIFWKAFYNESGKDTSASVSFSIKWMIRFVVFINKGGAVVRAYSVSKNKDPKAEYKYIETPIDNIQQAVDNRKLQEWEPLVWIDDLLPSEKLDIEL